MPGPNERGRNKWHVPNVLFDLAYLNHHLYITF